MKHIFDKLNACLRCNVMVGGVVAICFGVSLFGCGRTESENTPPPRDTFRSQVMFDLFDALEAKDVKVALASIERLRRFTEELEFLDLVEQRERNRRLTRTVKQFLERGEYDLAVGFLDEFMTQEGVYNFADRLRDRLNALRAIVAYRKNYPFASAADAEDQLTFLRRNTNELGEYDLFQRWLVDQREKIRDLRWKEMEKAARPRLAEADEATVNGRMDAADRVISQLALDYPEHPVVLLRGAMRDGDCDAVERILGEHRDKTSRQRHLEIAAALCWPAVKACKPVLDRLYDPRGKPTSPDSLSGAWLRIQLDLTNNRIAAAIRQARHVGMQTALGDRRLIEELLEQGILPREQFQARPWRIPFPTVTDVFNRITQIREFHGTKAVQPESDSP